ncbi:UPF0761 family protein [Natronomonas pharaonis DSM 2160]|uniref:UPF0761 family protein n=1 Tax=Natronomonas pharaonis (strain ATCC 35678 / DSM 2160 / CIP 103997 / JCM 8858 / NBRC 14720 / NCIMB 2260 / Gabara) TaxID=348780 RepID=A0A1U7ETG2_NATPD|nr:YihY/virulence factor BrkB family protein [Natronomonas pharaonis]CAI48187.1 UPF0761 family protein [Natronomonas pharaonis DSM 2160]
MKRHVDRTVAVTRGVVDGARSDRITFLAASLAYYGLVSLVPLLVLALVAASVVGEGQLIEALVVAVGDALGEQAGDVLGDALTGAAGRGGATLLGLAVFLWSGLKLFRGLDIAFSEVYGTAGPESLLSGIRNAVVTLGAVGLGVTATVAAGAAIAVLGVDAAVEGVALVGTLGLFVALTVAFLPLYYFLPGTDVSLSEAVPGAAFAAIGWTALQTGFRIYAGATDAYAAYGILGGVLLLVTFLYLGALVLLLGAVLNAVLAGRSPPSDPDSMTAAAGAAAPAAGRPPAPSADTTVPASAVTARSDTMTRDRPDDDASNEELREEIERLYDELDRFEERIEDRTVHRETLESDLRRYVRRRVRRGKARGWGPYLVLLYGTAMTLGAFYWLAGGWAVLAMVVIWLSTLGLYALMLIVGTTLTAAGLPGRLLDRVRDR